MLNAQTQFNYCRYGNLKRFIRKLKTNPNLILSNEVNGVAEKIGN